MCKTLALQTFFAAQALTEGEQSQGVIGQKDRSLPVRFAMYEGLE